MRVRPGAAPRTAAALPARPAARPRHRRCLSPPRRSWRRKTREAATRGPPTPSGASWGRPSLRRNRGGTTCLWATPVPGESSAALAGRGMRLPGGWARCRSPQLPRVGLQCRAWRLVRLPAPPPPLPQVPPRDAGAGGARPLARHRAHLAGGRCRARLARRLGVRGPRPPVWLPRPEVRHPLLASAARGACCRRPRAGAPRLQRARAPAPACLGCSRRCRLPLCCRALRRQRRGFPALFNTPPAGRCTTCCPPATSAAALRRCWWM